MAAVARWLVPALLAGVASGILAADGGWLDGARPLVLVGLAALGALVAVVLGRSTEAVIVAAMLLGSALGGWLGTAATLPVGPGTVGALVGREATIEGTVLDDPRPRETRQQLVLGLLRSGERSVDGRLLACLPRGIAIAGGDRLRIAGEPELAEDFDGFAYREFLARQGVGAILRARGASVIGRGADGLPATLGAVRRALLDGLLRIVPEPEAALGAGILLGVRSGIAPEIDDAFAAAGLTHVVAISGWNIAIVAALVAASLRPLRGRRGGRWIVAVVTAASIGGYVALTGAGPSVVRAGLMAGAMLVAQLSGSRTHALSALTLAALVMLIAAPPVLWDVGFQLSLLATAGLIALGSDFERHLRRLPGLVREPVALTLASQVTTLPVILLNFERLSLIAPLANVVVAPLVPIVMLVGTLAMLGGVARDAIGPMLDLPATLAAGATWLVLRLMVLAGSAAAAVPFASLDVSAPAWLAAAYYPALGLVLARRGPVPDAPRPPPPADGGGRLARLAFHPGSIGVTILVTVLGVALAGRPDGRLHVTALDVGQGDAILVTAPSGARMLVDGGPDPDLTLRRLGEVMPFWDRRIDVVLLTHPHEDHVAGLVDVLRRFAVRRVLEPGRDYENPSYARFLDLAAAEPGVTTGRPRAGQSLRLDASTIVRFLYPSTADAAAPLLEDDINNGSVVALVTCGGFSALLAGDAEAPVEALLLARGLPPADVLKVGHHGSESSSTPSFIGAVAARVGLISAGIDNEYGHPRQATLDALAAAGITAFRTDLDGTVDVTSDGRMMEIVSRRGRLGAALARPAEGCGQRTGGTATIGPWSFPIAPGRARFSTARSCRAAWWCMSRGSAAWRPRRRGSCRRPASRSTSGSSRSPPCCTISTRPRRATGPVNTGWSAPPSSTAAGTPSSPRRSPRIRCTACSTNRAFRAAGHR